MGTRAILGLLLLGAAAGLGALWSLAGSLAAPVPRTIGAAPADLEGAGTVRFGSRSGSRVHGWFAPGIPGRGCVVLAHAVRADRRGMLGRARFLRAAGYSVLLFDAQAHGESPGERITFGHLEALDAEAAVAFAASRDPAAPVAFLGVSQGGAAALLGPAPLALDALVLESVYPTIEAAVANRVAIRLGELGRLLAPLLLWQLEPRLGVPAEDLAPLRGIREIRAPLLLVAGERDRRTTLEESRALFAAAPRPKQLWVVPGASHEDLHGFATREYERRILGFLARHLGAAGD